MLITLSQQHFSMWERRGSRVVIHCMEWYSVQETYPHTLVRSV
ncbi:unnamed protein product [Brassica oleracea]|uniref:(rape) hypothetical protein n=1 Tax=Brassica napus TaxID=3708 RepID=A0A816LE05_BRANA|nr:unnamed protein product [Brassica napus]